MICLNKILVTGGAGFIGSHFADMCLEKGIRVVNYDAMKIGSMSEFGPDKIHPLYEFKQVDLAIDNYEIPYDVDAVVHLAAETHVDRSLSDPLSFINSNITGTYNLLNKMKGRNIRFHLVSTDEVYGDTIGNNCPSKETDMILSSSPYSASKAASEQLVISWGRTYNLDYTITRGCNTIGKRQNKEKLFPKFIWNAQNGIELPVYDGGGAVREYIHVTDHVQAIFDVLTKADSKNIYNVSSGFSASVNDVVNFLRKYYPNLRITDRESRAGHDMKYCISSDKIYNHLSWEPKFQNIEIFETAYNELR
jgi:dTDP-glucose 4,6-dehydratase